VVDAQAAGCKIVCTSSGGTNEIVNSGIMVFEDEWKFNPIKLYYPPQLDFTKITEIYSHQCEDKKNNIEKCAKKYYDLMRQMYDCS